ncbi:hypothetical protein KNV66_gp28 [Bacillus phage DLc1]|uniref:Uncharacterized protein n=1 Tax=Bacillus phage DLc1 TaxID=2777318 RepID=A0A7M1RPG3_9CAUD|nr:hypothetical protein KNV66_gp28 [Bacillus phage DLc1]QOR56275.1 hypothetical protein [Bacillus phage DLc1]
MEIVYVAEGIVKKIYGDDGSLIDVEIDGLEVLETLKPYIKTSFNTKPNSVKIKIEVEK